MKVSFGFFRRIKVRIALSFSLLFLVVAVPAIFYAFNQINVFFEGMYLQQMRVAARAINATSNSIYNIDSLSAEVSRITGTTVFLLDESSKILSSHYIDSDTSYLFSIPIPVSEAASSDNVRHQLINIGRQRFLQVQTELAGGRKLIQVKSFDKVSVLKARVREVIFWSSFLGLVALIAVAFWVSAKITKPLEILTGLAQKIRLDESPQKIEIKSPDEVGDLADALNDLIDNFNKAKIDIGKMEKAQRDFFGQMGERLEQPLLAIQGQLGKMLNAGKAGAISTDGVEQLGAALLQARKVQETIRTLIEISQLEHGETKLEIKPINLNQLLETTLAQFRNEAQRKELCLESKYEPGEPCVLADRNWLKVAFENLISNAVSYTETGYVKITCEEAGPMVLIKIEDSGRGIPRDQIERIFERFYRVESSDSQDKPGLGLVLTKEIIRAHGQKLEVESRLGVGSCFTFRLPKANMTSL
jgi:signal transduction histidine kinase